jgi:hypothetical protein
MLSLYRRSPSRLSTPAETMTAAERKAIARKAGLASAQGAEEEGEPEIEVS